MGTEADTGKEVGEVENYRQHHDHDFVCMPYKAPWSDHQHRESDKGHIYFPSSFDSYIQLP